MRLKPFFTYFGGKYRIAGKYPYPIHMKIIEPFAGSAGYSLRHYSRLRQVELWDVNPQIVGTWDYLIKSPESEILSLFLYQLRMLGN